MKPRPPEPNPLMPSERNQLAKFLSNCAVTHEKEEIQAQEPILSFALHKHAIKDWLLDFALCVRERDFDKARTMFSRKVVGFGTRARRVECLDDLMLDQWQATWPKTSGFQFNFEELDFFHDAHMAHVAVTWSSCGHRFGTKFSRKGRASLLLVGNKGQIQCASSHFSLDP